MSVRLSTTSVATLARCARELRSVTPLASYRYTCDFQIVFVFLLCLFFLVPETIPNISQHFWKIYPKRNPKLWKITVFATCVLLRFASQNTPKFIKKSWNNPSNIIPKSLKIHPKSLPEGVPAGILKNPCFLSPFYRLLSPSWEALAAFWGPKAALVGCRNS